MPIPWLVPAIAGVVSIVSAALSSRSSKKQTERTLDSQKELAQYSYQNDLEMWERQNKYNDPSAQMARYGAAGLNPNLIYSQGSAGNSSSTPRYDTPTADLRFKPFEIPEMLGMYQDFELKKAQIDNVKAQTSSTEQRTVNDSIREYLLDLQGRSGEFDLTRSKNLFPYQLEIQKGEARKVPATVEQEFQKLMNMRRQELELLLSNQTREKQLGTIDIEQEQKRADVLFSQYRNQWMKMGITTSDHPLLRIVTRMLDGAKIGTGYQGSIGGQIKSALPFLGGKE